MQELYNLTRQKILIIGGGSRMGLAVVRLVSNLGAEVIISSRFTEKLEQAAATVAAQVGIYTAEATDALATKQMLKALAPIDHIVVTASESTPLTLSHLVALGCALIDNFLITQDNLKMSLQWQLP